MNFLIVGFLEAKSIARFLMSGNGKLDFLPFLQLFNPRSIQRMPRFYLHPLMHHSKSPVPLNFRRLLFPTTNLFSSPPPLDVSIHPLREKISHSKDLFFCSIKCYSPRTDPYELERIAPASKLPSWPYNN